MEKIYSSGIPIRTLTDLIQHFRLPSDGEKRLELLNNIHHFYNHQPTDYDLFNMLAMRGKDFDDNIKIDHKIRKWEAYGVTLPYPRNMGDVISDLKRVANVKLCWQNWIVQRNPFLAW
jgi:hypothetical protein